MSRIKKYIEVVGPDDTNLSLITPDMFEYSDIDELQFDNGHVYIKFIGLNGCIPYNWFDEESKEKIKLWQKRKDSKLWKIIR